MASCVWPTHARTIERGSVSHKPQVAWFSVSLNPAAASRTRRRVQPVGVGHSRSSDRCRHSSLPRARCSQGWAARPRAAPRDGGEGRRPAAHERARVARQDAVKRPEGVRGGPRSRTAMLVRPRSSRRRAPRKRAPALGRGSFWETSGGRRGRARPGVVAQALPGRTHAGAPPGARPDDERAGYEASCRACQSPEGARSGLSPACARAQGPVLWAKQVFVCAPTQKRAQASRLHASQCIACLPHYPSALADWARQRLEGTGVASGSFPAPSPEDHTQGRNAPSRPTMKKRPALSSHLARRSTPV